MKSISKNSLNLLFIIAAAMSVLFISSPDKVSALEDRTQQDTDIVEVDEAQSESIVDQEVAQEEMTYEYIAQPGDSYSLIARKAVQTYGIKYETNLSTAQIIYAETIMTQAAESPYLNLGQKVDISEGTIKGYVEEALKMAAEEQAAWAYYVQFVSFDTDAVGETQS
jgi:hypothetical protein